MFGGSPKKDRIAGEEFYAFWHHFELGAFRTTVVAVGVIIAMGIVIALLLVSNRNKDATIRTLSEQRVMVGLPDKSGYFFSINELPEPIVLQFARNFVSNFFNYSPYNVVENLEEARRVMNPQLANDYYKTFQDTISAVREKNITRRLEIKAFKPPLTVDRGYIIEYKARLQEFVGNTPYGEPREIPVTVRLERVEHTKTSPEGLQVGGISDKPLELGPFAREADKARLAKSASEVKRP